MKENKLHINRAGAVASAVIVLAVLIVPMFLAPPVHAAADEGIMGWLVPDLLFKDFWAPTPGIDAGDVRAPDYGWVVLSFIALFIVFLLGGLSEMFAGLFGPRISTWGRGLMNGAGQSAIILAISAAAFVLIENAPSSFMGIGFLQITNAINFAETVRNTIIYEFLSMTTLTAILSTVGNITPYFRPAGVIGISFSLAPAFRPVFDSLGIMLSMLAVSVGTWFAQLWILLFVQQRLMATLMPPGLLMKAFGYARLGNVLIAIAIGFYFVYPFVLNLNAIAFENYLEATFAGGGVYANNLGSEFTDMRSCTDSTAGQGESIKCFFRLIGVESLNFIEKSINNSGVGSLLLLGGLTFLTGSIPSTFIFVFIIVFFLSLLKATLFYTLIVSVIMPLFNIFITLTAIKEITKFLGTEIDLSAFEKIF
ncbi:hypothetical protein COU37_02045 [Candidatus Micrarchaeota archaeon CG10_big_fil_rev_8_21_14_0_10_45_29]|nr:MAG: hypothetical protein COU37_02045 [Candidatus Micrarchaeota archaeon CG10_big_fil_rev_8_21_14_0_10_45_29]